MAAISPAEFRALAEFRYRIRSFLKFSELAAKSAGVEPQQHQLMLVVKAAEPNSAGIGYLAERLHLRRHSVVELVDRLEAHGLVRRSRSEDDRRNAEVRLSSKGSAILGKLTLHHHEELHRGIPALMETLHLIASQQEAKRGSASAKKKTSKKTGRNP
ncbi:MAG: MarR family transcriptional regulator [Acidobacteriota bacterium]